ncbi:MAG TPA: glycosyltransferase [Pyrinomonadaceae bacterium]|nr:glycosyltransferase [Pyrinomonadaceae bacterium]
MAKKLRDALPPGVRFWLRLQRAKLIRSWQALRNPKARSHQPDFKSEYPRPGFLAFDDHMLAPERDTGSARTALILKSFAALGPTTFISLSNLNSTEDERLLKAAGIEVAPWTEYQRLLKVRDYQIALLSRADVAAAVLPSLRRSNPKIKTIFETVDLTWRRLEREHELTGEKSVARRAARYRKIEARLARDCDQVWCITEEEEELLAREAPGAWIRVIPTIHPLQDQGKSFDERDGLLFIGNFLHKPNVDAIHYFMREVHPLIRNRIGVKTFIVGPHAPPEIVSYASDEVVVTGYVDDINPLFQSCRVFLAPLLYGGMKGKIGQALSYGLPVVATSIGAEGFELSHDVNVMLGDVPEAFAQGVIDLYTQPELWRALSENGRTKIADHFTPEAVSRTIDKAISELIAADRAAR